MIRRSALILSVISAGMSLGCSHGTTPPIMEVYSIYVSNDGTAINLLISAPSYSDTLGILCKDNVYFDTVIVDRSVDTIRYALDSTFLLKCAEHDKIFLLDGSNKLISLSFYGIESDILSSPLRVVLGQRDTLFLNDDTSGYTVRTSEYVKVQKYTGGLYAPLPPEGYDTLIVAGSNDTLIVWQDYDHDGVSGYDGDDIFWVVLIKGDSGTVDVRTIARRPLSEDDPLAFTGYRGLELCFKCMEGKR